MVTRTSRRARGDDPQGDIAAAAALLAENIALLTGRAPARDQPLAGRAHAHRVALYCPAPDHGTRAVCLQILAIQPEWDLGPGERIAQGWLPVEAQAIAESLDLRRRDDERAGSFPDFVAWRRTTGPSYYLVLVDRSKPPVDTAVLDQRAAALEAGYLDGAAWIRFHAGHQFAEGTFGRLVHHLAHQVRDGSADRTQPDSPSTSHRGLC